MWTLHFTWALKQQAALHYLPTRPPPTGGFQGSLAVGPALVRKSKRRRDSWNHSARALLDLFQHSLLKRNQTDNKSRNGEVVKELAI